jgi:hypothetical protein
MLAAGMFSYQPLVFYRAVLTPFHDQLGLQLDFGSDPMKPMTRLLLFAIGSFFCTCSIASAQTSDGWWFLDFQDTSGAALQPLNIGIDARDGRGFGFVIVADDDGDGVIHLPPVPNGGGLVMGVDVDTDVVQTQTHGGTHGCDIWIFTDLSCCGPIQSQIRHPLLIVAEDVEGQAFGMDFSAFPFPQPPTRTLVPGERLTATDGQLADWPGLRLAAGPDPADLADFLRSVDTWPNFSGDVIVTSLLLSGTYVPEPGSIALAALGVIGITIARRKFLAIRRRQRGSVVDAAK